MRCKSVDRGIVELMHDNDRVKVVDLTRRHSKTALVGAAIGAVSGAVSTAAALNRKANSETGSARTTENDGPGEKSAVGAFDREATGIDDAKAERGVKAKLLKLGERHGWRWLGRAMQVQRRFAELNGNNIAAAVALQVFLSIFPLLLVAAAVVGFLQSGSSADVAQRLVNNFGLEGTAAETLKEAVGTATESRKASSVLGLLTLAWSALGVTSALQYAYNQSWQTNGRGLKDKAVGAVWLVGASFLFVGSAAITTLLHWLPAGLGIVATLTSILVTFGLWLFTGKVLPNVDVSWRDLVPGAIVGVIGLELLKIAGAVWVPKAVESSSSLYGTVGIVFAVLAWVLLVGRLVVYCAIVNVITYEAKHGVVETTLQMPKAAAAKSGGEVTRSGAAETR